jgi:ubiquinone/menaquinone biosynthesis C-methylase UbiE
MSGGDLERALLEAARLEPDDDVLVLGGSGVLVFGAHEQVGDGWVYAVRSHVDELEELLGDAHAAGASGVAYLVGEAPVMPLPDASVAAALGRLVVDEAALGAAAEELARVLSPGGRVALAEVERASAAAVAEALAGAGFAGVDLAEAGGELVVAGRRG